MNKRKGAWKAVTTVAAVDVIMLLGLMGTNWQIRFFVLGTLFWCTLLVGLWIVVSVWRGKGALAPLWTGVVGTGIYLLAILQHMGGLLLHSGMILLPFVYRQLKLPAVAVVVLLVLILGTPVGPPFTPYIEPALTKMTLISLTLLALVGLVRLLIRMIRLLRQWRISRNARAIKPL